MNEMLLLADEFSMPIKLGWILWLTWALFQVAWYRRAGAGVAVSGVVEHREVKRPARKRVRVRKSAGEVPADARAVGSDVPSDLPVSQQAAESLAADAAQQV